MFFSKKQNADEGKGQVFFGLHFYPGVAQYSEPNQKPYRVFLNENTLREMDPTFSGCPVFVRHVDEVEPDLDTLRGEADGWVSESFYNKADGKHWVRFITVSEKATQAIKRGWKLSNCYVPKSFGPSGMWNGIDYEREIKSGEYEHLAIVPNPRYEESIILTPDEFKKYNEEKLEELKKLSNNLEEKPMKFNFFKKAKVENSADMESMSVMLPKSGKEITLAKLINEADDAQMNLGEPQMANLDHHVEVEGKKMTVNELIGHYKDACAAKVNEDSDDDAFDPAAENEIKEEKENEVDMDDEDAKKKALMIAEHEDKEIKEAKKANAKAKAEKLRNAPNLVNVQTARVELSMDQVARGKARYGSN